jgi:Leucine-rich repeat (LRR) protein
LADVLLTSENLRGFGKLESLSLIDFPRLFPETVEAIAEMTQLTWLYIPVAEEDLPKLSPLQKLTNLEYLMYRRNGGDNVISGQSEIQEFFREAEKME